MVTLYFYLNKKKKITGNPKLSAGASSLAIDEYNFYIKASYNYST